MTDPILTAVASALAGKAAEAFVSGGRSALAGLYRLVRARFSTRRQARALERAVGDPDDANVRALAAELQQLTANDSEFAEQLRELWEQSKGELQHAEVGGVINDVSGTVSGHTVQARDIHGSISLGAVSRSDA